MEFAHKLYQANYNKKCNYVRHWNGLQREQKWKTQSTQSADSKRTKISVSRVYSFSSNLKMLMSADVVGEFLVRPQGTKASKRKDKRKSKAF